MDAGSDEPDPDEAGSGQADADEAASGIPDVAAEPPPPPPPSPPPPPPPEREQPSVPVFDTPNILWHFGALFGTAASIGVISQVHPSARGFWILLVSLVFIAAYAFATVALLRAGWPIPGGIVASAAVTFVPIAALGLERLIGVAGGTGVSSVAGQVTIAAGGADTSSSGSSFQGHDLALALATVVAGLIVYALVRYAFVFAWVAIAGLIAVQIFLPAIDSSPGVSDRADTLLATGVVFLGIGLYCDLVHARRIGFWWHLVGLWAIAGGLAYHTAFHSSPGWVIVLIAGVAVLVLAAPLRRATWALFGLLGTYAPLYHYSSAWFGTLGSAFALVVVGFAFVAGGLVIQSAGDSWTDVLARRARHA